MRLWRRRREPGPRLREPFVGVAFDGGLVVMTDGRGVVPVVDPLKVRPDMTREQRDAVMAQQQVIVDRVLRADRILASDLPLHPVWWQCRYCGSWQTVDASAENRWLLLQAYCDWTNEHLTDFDLLRPEVMGAAMAEASRGVSVPAALSPRMRVEDLADDPARTKVRCAGKVKVRGSDGELRDGDENCERWSTLDLSPAGQEQARELRADDLQQHAETRFGHFREGEEFKGDPRAVFALQREALWAGPRDQDRAEAERKRQEVAAAHDKEFKELIVVGGCTLFEANRIMTERHGDDWG
jgi:hypothetical protein